MKNTLNQLVKKIILAATAALGIPLLAKDKPVENISLNNTESIQYTMNKVDIGRNNS